MKLQQSTQAELKECAHRRCVMKFSTTEELGQGVANLERQGLSGTVLYAKTTNMMKAQDALLAIYKPPFNRQRLSNSPEAPGYVLAVVPMPYCY